VSGRDAAPSASQSPRPTNARARRVYALQPVVRIGHWLFGGAHLRDLYGFSGWAALLCVCLICPEHPFRHEAAREFTTTHWSAVLLAGADASAEANRALGGSVPHLRCLKQFWFRFGKNTSLGTKRYFSKRSSRTSCGDTMVNGYDEIAARLGMSAGAVHVAMHRLRDAYRDLLRAEVSRTVGAPADVDEELHHLAAALRS
jgi:hypothetical protein